jgi:hypothetical protein
MVGCHYVGFCCAGWLVKICSLIIMMMTVGRYYFVANHSFLPLLAKERGGEEMEGRSGSMPPIICSFLWWLLWWRW